jgi:hypothetical protein
MPTTPPAATPTATATPTPTATPTATPSALNTTTQTPAPQPSHSATSSGSGGLTEVLLIVVIALAALAVGFWAGRRNTRSFRPRQDGQPPTGSVRDELAAGAAADWKQAEAGRPWLARQDQDQDAERARGDRDAAAERARLVASCASLADKLRDRQPALFGELTRGLEAVGVTVETADGERFDAQRHNPIGTEPTADPAADLLVAATVRVGYRDHGTVVRSPDVIVYRAAGNGYGG